MKSKLIIVASSAAILILLFFLGARLFYAKKSEKLGFLAQQNAGLFVPEDAPIKGAERPSVYLVEFLDPECEACRAFYPFVKQLISDYKNELAVVVRYATFHKNSKFAVKLLEASRKQNKYWETLDILFTYQPYWADHHDPRPDRVWEFLPEIGLDTEKLKKDMDDPAIDKRIARDLKDGDLLGVSRTPTFFVNGRPLVEFGREPLVKLIEEEIKRVKNGE